MSAIQTLSLPTPPAALRRGAFLASAIAVLFLLAGDGAHSQSSSGGIDPLEILKLSVRPNALIVLDTSGSMHEDLNGNQTAGDDPRSKIFQAKQVLTDVITANQTKVSFQFGQYQVGTTTKLQKNTNNRFLYTTTDANAANLTINTGNNSGVGLYRITTGNFSGVAPSLTDPGTGGTVYHLAAGQFWNGQTITVNSNGNGGSAGTVCSTATGSLTVPPTVTVIQLSGTACNTSVARQATFTFRGAISWNDNGDNEACNGYQIDVSLQKCDNNDQLTAVSPFLRPEIQVDATGNLPGYSDGTGPNATPTTPALYGLRALDNTPIAASLDTIRGEFNTLYNSGLTGPPAIGAIKNQPAGQRQRTFVIFVTDGDDTCAQTSGPSNSGDNEALTAAYSAQLLDTRLVAADPASAVTTFVVITGNGASASRANWEAWGGSGMVIPPVSGSVPAWKRIPTAGDRANCTTCVDAFLASDSAGLTVALQAAIDAGASFGEFSDQLSIAESVFELGSTPLDPNTRYNTTHPALYQSTFELPTWAGHLNAFVNDGGANGGAALQLWDAGAKLCTRVTGFASGDTGASPDVCATSGTIADPGAMGTGAYTFAQLTGGATPSNVSSSSARIKRRIYTTSGNGVNSGYTATNLANNTVASSLSNVPLWPPDTNVAPTAASNPAGVLDASLGLSSMTIAQLQAAPLNACTGTNLPTACSSATPSVKLAQAVREAREMILAYTAGAAVQLDPTLGLPVRNATNQLMYVARNWILAESTLAGPGVVAQPPDTTTSQFSSEYTLYRDGPRDASGHATNGLALGLGLRNPDKDGTAASQNDNTLKPVMTVVYHATNGMLHALRAGPCPASISACSSETGGEELWGFVPFDQLGKLLLRMSTQTRTNHTYMFATPVRFADVFVPDTSGSGVWRVIMLLGRGAGGKYMTALDVTTPGTFLTPVLQTQAPLVVWSRGNPDTTDGIAGSGHYNNIASDYTAFAKMGQTWSVPSIGFATPANNVTSRKAGGVNFVAWVGSGPSDVSTEGKTFFALDALTGDVISTNDIADGTTATSGLTNALEANVSGFAANALTFQKTVNSATEKVTAVYFPDLHSRIWKFNPDTPATAPTLFADVHTDGDQPFGNAVALLNASSDATGAKPHVFAEAGNDNRVALPQVSPFFRAYAYRDDSTSTTTTSTLVFSAFDFLVNFRGIVQPLAAFDQAGTGIVFYSATRFNPPDVTCVSSFDSQVVALNIATGGAAYAFGGSDQRSTIVQKQRVIGLGETAGQVVVSTSLGAGAPPPPPPPPAVQANAGARANLTLGPAGNTNLDGVPLTTYKLGSSVCK